jgi:hypothetical protein
MKKYVNGFALIGAITSFLMFYINISYPKNYDYNLNPTNFSHKTGNMVFSYIIFFMDKYLGKVGVLTSFLLLSIFFFFISFNWPEIINWLKRKK